MVLWKPATKRNSAIARTILEGISCNLQSAHFCSPHPPPDPTENYTFVFKLMIPDRCQGIDRSETTPARLDSTLYHVLASELLRSSSLVGKGRERNEFLKKISKTSGNPSKSFIFAGACFRTDRNPGLSQTINTRASKIRNARASKG